MSEQASDVRPEGCCGVCPPIVGGGYDCTCSGNPRCKGPRRDDHVEREGLT